MNKELKEAIEFLELNAYEGSNDKTILRMGDIEEVLKPIRKLVKEHFKLVEEHEIIKQKYDHALEILEEKTVVPKRFWRKWL